MSSPSETHIPNRTTFLPAGNFPMQLQAAGSVAGCRCFQHLDSSPPGYIPSDWCTWRPAFSSSSERQCSQTIPLVPTSHT